MTCTRARHLGDSPTSNGQRAPRSSSSDHSVASAAPHACGGSTARASVHRVRGRSALALAAGCVCDPRVGPAGRSRLAPGAATARADGGGVLSTRLNGSVSSRPRARVVPTFGSAAAISIAEQSPKGHLHRRRPNRLHESHSCEQTSNTGCTRRRAAGLCSVFARRW